jgi:antitoxin component YwqK of YwqJK toxin-antitoxin module
MRLIGAPDSLIEFNEHIYLADQRINLDQFYTQWASISGGTYVEDTPTYLPGETYKIKGKVYSGFTSTSTYEDVNIMGLFPLDSTPASTQKIITKGEFIDDMQEGLWVYETPEYKEIGRYVNDKPDSLWKRYYMPKEKLRFEGKFINGDEDGQHTWYYENGRKMTQGKYTGGMKQNDWKFYDEAGFNYLTILQLL